MRKIRKPLKKRKMIYYDIKKKALREKKLNLINAAHKSKLDDPVFQQVVKPELV